jgi:hypothetical protein
VGVGILIGNLRIYADFTDLWKIAASHIKALKTRNSAAG